jgi:hypothetical protein
MPRRARCGVRDRALGVARARRRFAGKALTKACRDAGPPSRARPPVEHGGDGAAPLRRRARLRQLLAKLDLRGWGADVIRRWTPR